MGLTIHYGGRLKNANLLGELIEDVKDFAATHDWEYKIFKTSFPNNQFSEVTERKDFYGINFTPPKCETVSLVFHPDGRMINIAAILLFDEDDPEYDPEWSYMTFTKTQFAGPMIHKLLILYFRYLDKKYFQDFQMTDESEYWETNDEELLLQKFTQHGMIIDMAAAAFEGKTRKEFDKNENFFEEIFAEILRKLRELDG